MPNYGLGFESVETEYDAVPLPVAGEVPAWLDGVLLRNGPGRFEAGGESLAHWFDGLAMLRRFAFEDGGVTYSNRFLRSEEYRSVVESGRVAGGQFGTPASGGGGGLLRRLARLAVPQPTDNANVNAVRIGGEFVAITETPLGVRFDPASLATQGRFEYGDDLGAQWLTAHPQRDAARGVTVNLGVEFGATNRYRVFRLRDGETRRELVASRRVREPAYIHSFGLTPRFVVLVEFPFVVDPLRLLAPTGESFVEAYRWKPARGTRFVVFDRGSGRVVAEPLAPPFFAFHHVNANECDGEVVVDLVAFNDPSPVESLYLDSLRSGSFDRPMGELRRYRVDLDRDRVHGPTRFAEGLSLPRTSPAVHMRPYRYAYAQHTPDRPAGEFPTGLAKVDLETGETTVWRDSGSYPGEPVFVPRPGGERGDDRGGEGDEDDRGGEGDEDDGVVLSVALEPAEERSSLVVLDAGSFEEVARARLPHHLPFDFHGQFYDGSG